MKRLSAALCLFIISVTLGAVVKFSVNYFCNTFIAQAESCLYIAKAEDAEALIEASRRLNESWERLYGSFTLVTSRNNLETAEMSIPALSMLAENKAFDIYIEKCTECISSLEILKNNERVTLGNVF